MKKYLRHNMSQTPEYRAWANIKSRCYNGNHRDYHYYGGKGVTMSVEWLNDFKSFYRDMGKRPSAQHSIDRIDTSKNYSKDNCRWASKKLQVINRGSFKNNTHQYKGMSKTPSGRWQARIKNNGKLISLGTFDTEYEAALAYNSAAIALFGDDSVLNKLS